jgi:hypothetical protein
MPKTALFQTDLCIDRHYRRKQENREIDVDDFIKPGMTFIMEYTHTKIICLRLQLFKSQLYPLIIE